MQRLTDTLGTSWPAWLLLLAATGCVAAFAVRRFSSAWALGAGLTFGALGLGGLILDGVPVELLGTRTDLASLVTVTAAAGLGVAVAALVLFRAWAFGVGIALGVMLLAGVGGLVVRPAGAAVRESAGSVGGVQFVQPQWLALLVLVPLVYVVSRRSLTGLGPTRKWAAIGLRAAGLTLLALALAEPRLRRPTDATTVLFVVDRSFSIPQDIDPNVPVTDVVDRRWEKVRSFIEKAVKDRPAARRNDRSGLILFGKRPKLSLPPAAVDALPVDERMAGPIDGNYTDIAAALKLALASFPEGTGKRVVLFSDGNENLGLSEEQADLAKKNNVQIDTVALAPGFRNESEVLVQAIESPAVAAQGQRLPIRVLVRNATPGTVVDGRLDVVKTSVGETTAVDIEDSPQVLEPGKPPKVRLLPGLTVFKFRNKVDPQGDSSFTFRATFTPTDSRPVQGGTLVAGLPGDRVANNRVETAVVARGQRKVLLIDENAPGSNGSAHDYLLATLRYEPGKAGGPPVGKLRVDRRAADQLPQDKGELGVFLSNYDAVILANVPFERFNADQAEMLRAAVYDQGCGLVMIGGPDSFGAGGYQATPIEAALPVDCEIKALKAAGKGGLVLVMHASEMADGNKWQKDIAKLAIQRLGPADMVGVVQYGGFGGGGAGVSWHIPFQAVGEVESTTRNRLLARLDALTPGDMPDFDPFLVAAYDTLSDPKYNLSVKHSIVISDGDPNYSGPGQKAVAAMAAAGITCTTVGVATHGVNEDAKLKSIAEGTNDGDGKKGNFYKVTNPDQLPGIYIKESRRVSQSFISKEAFTPERTAAAGSAEALAPGLPQPLPRLYGFVRTTLKQNVLVNMSLKGPSPYPDQEFPLLASWRYGLGKAVAFTADARTQPDGAKQYWDKDWAASEVYRKFWEQVVNWVMREPERGKLTLVTEYRDGRVRVTADVRDEKDRPVGGVTLKGAVTTPKPLGPGEKSPAVEFRPKGGGLYEAEFAADEAGSYFLNVNALTPLKNAAGNTVLNPDGSAQMTAVDAGRAGVTVPYSPEFADLESNTPLMKRLADITGGSFHTEADDDLRQMLADGHLFRDPPASTRALLPFWFWLVFAAAVLLVFDVGVRRIALEWKEVAAGATTAWTRLRHEPAFAGAEGENLGRLLKRKQAVGETLVQGRARKRFDPTSGPALPVPDGADAFAARPTAPPKPAPAARATEPAAEEDDTFAKLRRAKERARREQQLGDGER